MLWLHETCAPPVECMAQFSPFLRTPYHSLKSMFARLPVLLALLSTAQSAVAVPSQSVPQPYPHHYRHPGHIDPGLFGHERGHRQHATRLLRIARTAHMADGSGVADVNTGIINPADFGADPTGKADASDALGRAVAAAS